MPGRGGRMPAAPAAARPLWHGVRPASMRSHACSKLLGLYLTLSLHQPSHHQAEAKGRGSAEKARAAQAVSAEEAARRRDELARMRSLLFHQEAKLKRLARIKSKDYHRRALRAAKAKARARARAPHRPWRARARARASPGRS